MISIPYQSAYNRYAMFMMNEQDVCADIVCRQGMGQDTVPTELNFGREHHRVYRIGGWVVEQCFSVLAIYRIPGRESLHTQIAISFDHPVEMTFVLCNGDEDVIRQDEVLCVMGICLNDGIVVQTNADDEYSTAEQPGPQAGQAAELERLLQQCEEQASELSGLREENARLKEENARLTCEGLDRQRAELLRRKDGLTQEITDKQSKMEMLTAECETMQAQKERLEQQVQDTQMQIGQLKLNLEDLRRCMEEYERHQVEALSHNQLVEIDVETTMDALSGSFEELLCTQDVAALLDQADVAESLMKAEEIIAAAKKTLREIICAREELDKKIHQSLRRASSKEGL